MKGSKFFTRIFSAAMALAVKCTCSNIVSPEIAAKASYSDADITISASTSSISDAVDYTAVANAYNKIISHPANYFKKTIKSEKKEFGKNRKKKNYRYKLVDITGDGIPELFLEGDFYYDCGTGQTKKEIIKYDSYSPYLNIFTYKSGKAVRLTGLGNDFSLFYGVLGCSLFRASENKGIYLNSVERFTGDNYYDYYKVNSKNKLVRVSSKSKTVKYYEKKPSEVKSEIKNFTKVSKKITAESVKNAK